MAEDVQAGQIEARLALHPVERGADAVLGVVGMLAASVVRAPVEDPKPPTLKAPERREQVVCQPHVSHVLLGGQPVEDRPDPLPPAPKHELTLEVFFRDNFTPNYVRLQGAAT